MTIQTKTVALTTRNSTTINFVWNTTGWARGNYTLTTYASLVPGKRDTTDNTFTESWVIAAMISDITGPECFPDRKVDMRDVSAVAKLFGISYPDPRYKPNCDVVYDLKIDMKDISVIAKEFGKTV